MGDPMSNDERNLYAPEQRQNIESKVAPDYALKKRMERLVKAVLEGRVVPFLGAGISMYASLRPDHAADAPPLPAGKIAENLGKALRDAIASGDNYDLPTSHLVNRAFETAGHKEIEKRLFDWLVLNNHPLGAQLHSALGTPGQASHDDHGSSSSVSEGSAAIPITTSVITVERGSPAIKPIPLQLGEIAELCWAILGPVKTCDILRLEEWNRYLPTPAHHYLAILVREGLVTEILETNYDEFVEEAVRETFGPRHGSGDKAEGERRREEGVSSTGVRRSKRRKVDAALVIHDLDSYRAHIAQPRRPSKSEALVKVIKLNGCAVAYRENLKRSSEDPEKTEQIRNDAAQKILLTEEQLQNWGPKAWAQELLRDRVRSRALLFIGFGNQDPIVRHHAVAVIREFSPNESAGDRDWFEMENAPFVMAYEKNLTFFQFQILRAFRDAHEHKKRSTEGSAARTLDQVATVYMNTFLGEDGMDLGGKEKTLPANLFLGRVAGLAICKHVSEVYFSGDSALGSYLFGAVRQPHVLLNHVKRTLLDGDVENQPAFEGWLQLAASSSQQISSAWAEVCFAIQGKDAGRAGYRPFLDAPVKQPMLLALMALLSMYGEPSRLDAPDLKKRCGSGAEGSAVAGFRLLDGDPSGGRCALYATSNYNSFIGDNGSKRIADGPAPVRRPPNNAVVILLGRGTQAAFRQHRWIATGERDDERDLIEVIAIGDLLALRGSSVGPVSLAVARQNLERLTRDPETVLGSEENWQGYCVEES